MEDPQAFVSGRCSVSGTAKKGAEGFAHARGQIDVLRDSFQRLLRVICGHSRHHVLVIDHSLKPTPKFLSNLWQLLIMANRGLLVSIAQFLQLWNLTDRKRAVMPAAIEPDLLRIRD